MSRNPKPNLTKKEIGERVFQRASGLSLKESRAAVELTLEALERMRLEPVATVAWWLAATGVRLDYTPAAVDAATSGGTGVARGQILLAWRIDAWGSPAFIERRR